MRAVLWPFWLAGSMSCLLWAAPVCCMLLLVGSSLPHACVSDVDATRYVLLIVLLIKTLLGSSMTLFGELIIIMAYSSRLMGHGSRPRGADLAPEPGAAPGAPPGPGGGPAPWS